MAFLKEIMLINIEKALKFEGNLQSVSRLFGEKLSGVGLQSVSRILGEKLIEEEVCWDF